MPVVLVVGILAILVGVFYVAIGRGGELAYEQADHAPLDLGPVSATDVALLRPPTALWGYNMQVTDEALDRIARALRDRDILIASLQRQLSYAGRGAPAVTSIEAEALLGATGLTQAARWDEVIIARDEAAAALDDAATALDAAAAVLDQGVDQTAPFETEAPATEEIPTGETAETTALETTALETGESREAREAAEAAEQPRRFVPRHERPRKAPRTATQPANATDTDTADSADTADPAKPSDVAAFQDKPDDAEEQGW